MTTSQYSENRKFENIESHVNSSPIAYFYVYLIKPRNHEIIRVFLNKRLFLCTYILNCYETQRAKKTNIGYCVAAKKMFYLS